MRFLKEGLVTPQISAEREVLGKALDRHVGEGQQMIERDPMGLHQLLPVLLFQRLLGWWQKGPGRVVNKIKLQR